MADDAETAAAQARGKAKVGEEVAGGAASSRAPTTPAEGLVGSDSDDEEPGGAAGASGTATSDAERIEQLKEMLDSLKASLHAERASCKDKDVQIHRLLAERDLVVGAHSAGPDWLDSMRTTWCRSHAPLADEHRRAAQKEVEALKVQLAREHETNREAESQLQDVLGLWESAAGDARSEAAAEVADLRKQLDVAHARLADGEDAKKESERKMRAEIENIMALWEEAQATSAAEIEQLQERVIELKDLLAQTRERQRRAEGALEDFNF